MKAFTVITDPGIDDLIALLVLNKLSPKSKNHVVSAFGNVPEKYGFQNAKEFICLTAKKRDLVHGSGFPLSGSFEHSWLYNFHGSDGVWNVHPQINSSIVNVSEGLKNVKNIISLASLTDVYKLLTEHKKTLKTTTVMGGAFNDRGNYTDYAECNIVCDSKAASLFFSNCEEIDVKVVPLDVTRKETTIDKIPEYNKTNRWIKKILKTWYSRYYPKKKNYFKVHDPLAVYLTFFPEKAVWKKSGIKVILSPKKRGKTEFSNTKPICKVALDLKNPDKIAQEIFDIAFN